jgi:carbamoyl-phosphate synthase large subunit
MDPMGIILETYYGCASDDVVFDPTFQRMRDMAILMMRSIGNLQEVVTCNLPLSPDEKEDIVALK